MGMPASICAPSNAPMETLSRILAQEASLDMAVFNPYFLKQPFSRVITIGAQSVRGMMPNTGTDLFRLSVLPAQALLRAPGGTIAIKPAAAGRLMDFLRNSLRSPLRGR